MDDVVNIETYIFNIREKQVMFDFHLAEFYNVETRSLKQSVRRNITRFPEDFMFTLTKEEWSELITNCDNLPDKVKYSPSLPVASPRPKIGYIK